MKLYIWLLMTTILTACATSPSDPQGDLVYFGECFPREPGGNCIDVQGEPCAPYVSADGTCANSRRVDPTK